MTHISNTRDDYIVSGIDISSKSYQSISDVSAFPLSSHMQQSCHSVLEYLGEIPYNKNDSIIGHYEQLTL